MSKPGTSGQKLKLLLAGLVVLCLVIALFLVFGSVKESFRVGRVQSVERTGTFFKSTEVHMLVEKGDSLKTWHFSVSDQDSATSKNLEISQIRNQRIKVEYREKYLRFFWQPESRDVATHVELIEN